MRALVVVLVATLTACRPDVPATNARDPAASIRVHLRYDFRDRRAAPSPPVETNVPAASTPASECFAEPVTYTRRVTIKPTAGDIDERLRQCDASAGGDAQACRFGVAREYFDANRFERAGPLLLAIAHDANAADAARAALLAFD